ncbi:hypothetical protein L484_022265 [Morus notabilis]|uniref:Uncharacterized protein n=1 Tax=Morus notabilis TaxID=981085 RepID=W9SUR5_9ROSA|nr:hypothetical protein L484_022265 [Morus notabilis]
MPSNDSQGNRCWKQFRNKASRNFMSTQGDQISRKGDYDGKVTPEEVESAAMYLNDTLGKEGLQELISSLSKDRGQYVLSAEHHTQFSIINKKHIDTLYIVWKYINRRTCLRYHPPIRSSSMQMLMSIVYLPLKSVIWYVIFIFALIHNAI